MIHFVIVNIGEGHPGLPLNRDAQGLLLFVGIQQIFVLGAVAI